MWSKWEFTTSVYYDYVFIECNPSAGAMFLEEIYRHHNTELKCISKSDEPAITNITEYITTDNICVRVISMNELIEKGLVCNCVQQVNLLFVKDHECVSELAYPQF